MVVPETLNPSIWVGRSTGSRHREKAHRPEL